MRKTSCLLTAAWLTTVGLFSQNKGASPLANPQSATANPHSTRAVVIGISDYQEAQIPDLRFADKDALAFANFLRSPAGGSLDNDHLLLLTNEKATAGQFAAALDWLIEQTKEGDEAIIYFSGHGDVERNTISQPGFLLCWDAPGRVYMGGGTYSLVFLQEIVQTLSNQNKARVVVITDACHAGKLAGSQIGGAQLTAANAAKQFSNEAKILSCQPNEFSLEGDQWGGGRGVFSYHLIDGLFGLADRNGDGNISLFEIGRYLEDNVTAEAAPQSQIPMVLGNKTDRLAAVDAAILAGLKKSKSAIGGLPMFAATEGRGFENEALGKADSSLRRLYFSFKKAVAEKRFFSPEADCAEVFYAQLAANEALAPLRGMMKRNYAAALQDDAQQAINIWLKADVRELDCIGRSLKLEPLPRQLGRAAELLGENHYMWRSLRARKLLFEGILMQNSFNPDERLGQQLIDAFQKSAALEPGSPLPWHRMCLAQLLNLRHQDSAFACAAEARRLAPAWVLPYADLGLFLFQYEQFGASERALQEASAIDSLHPLVLARWASWHGKQPGGGEKAKALALFEQYREGGGAMYACWHNEYGLLLQGTGRFGEAEAEFQKALALDSSKVETLNNLGELYSQAGRFGQAAPLFEKILLLDSTFFGAWNNLGAMYLMSGNLGPAEQCLRKAIEIDPTNHFVWDNLGKVCLNTGRPAEAEEFIKKAIALAPAAAVHWTNLGGAYLQMRRFDEAGPAFKKAIELDPATPGAYRGLGTSLLKMGRPAEARPMFLKVIELDPNARMARLGMAAVAAAEGKTAEAIDWAEQAILKKVAFEQLQQDEDLAPLRALPEWKALMKKHFPDKVKD